MRQFMALSILAVDTHARASFTLLTYSQITPRFSPQAGFTRSVSNKIRRALAAFFLRVFTLSSNTLRAVHFLLTPNLSVLSFEGCFNEMEGIH